MHRFLHAWLHRGLQAELHSGCCMPSCMVGVCTDFLYVSSHGYCRQVLHAWLHGTAGCIWGVAWMIVQGGLHAQLRTGLHSLGLYPLLEALKAGRTWRQALFQLHSSWQTCSGASSASAVTAGELTARQARGWLNAPVEIWILLALGLQLSVPH